MHLPAHDVLAEMQPEGGGLWFVPAQGSDTHAILVKAPSSVIKAISRGSRIEFLIGMCAVEGAHYLGIGVRVHDDPVSPVTYFRIQRNAIQHRAILDILTRSSTPLFFFDELCRSVAWAECKPDRIVSAQAIGKIHHVKTPYFGVFNRHCNAVLDAMHEVIDPPSIEGDSPPLDFVWLPVEIETLYFINIHAVGIVENHAYRANQTDEGGGQEVNAWHLLESLFPVGIVKSPSVIEGKKERELIDILCYYTDEELTGLFLVESKALSVLSVAPDQSMERKTKNQDKHIVKALNQCKGAIASIRAGCPISTRDGAPLKFDRSGPPHVIILVAEILPFGDRQDIVNACLSFAHEAGAFVHVMDMWELTTFVSASKNCVQLDFYLFERFKKFIEHRNLLMRANFVQSENESVDRS
ncbi:hypothetical protein AB4Y40_20840 [Paraburkholderia sp. EG287B]|uniref:hypothetical protein n=1 Tax=Paraburkholderia sp. EG287B TaxID=3237010 RepID=UPI0034D2D5C6